MIDSVYVLLRKGFVLGVFISEDTARTNAQMIHNNDRTAPEDMALFHCGVTMEGGGCGGDSQKLHLYIRDTRREY